MGWENCKYNEADEKPTIRHHVHLGLMYNIPKVDSLTENVGKMDYYYIVPATIPPNDAAQPAGLVLSGPSFHD